MKNELHENTDEEIILLFLKNIIKNTIWDEKLFIVGGYVRDEIMGIKSKDLDFVVYGDINAGIKFSIWLAKKLENYKEGSNPVIYPRFGTSKLSLLKNNSGLSNIGIDINTFIFTLLLFVLFVSNIPFIIQRIFLKIIN